MIIAMDMQQDEATGRRGIRSKELLDDLRKGEEEATGRGVIRSKELLDDLRKGEDEVTGRRGK